ncbi:MAG: LamG domain-containing protein [Mucilaginibacter sp.]
MKKLKNSVAAIIIMIAVMAAIQSCKKSADKVDYNANKSTLNTAIDSATLLYSSTVPGHQAGEYDSVARVALKTAIDLATTVKTGSFTQYQVNNAQANLGRVVAQYKNTIVQDVSPANLIAEWKFNGDAKDATGNGHDGILKTGYIGSSAAAATDGGTLPTLTADRFGRANMAYHFDKGATVAVPFSSSLNVQSFTISVWLSRDNTNSNNYFFSFNRWNTFKFQLQGSNLPFLTLHTSASYYDIDDHGKSVANANQWTHVAVSYDSATGTEKFYIAGTLVYATAPNTISGSLVPAPSNTFLAIGNEMVKDNYVLTDDGSDPNHYWGPDYFIGSLSNIRFYSKALSDNEVHSIYSIESAP